MVKLSPRLDAVASLVRDNTAFADIGCDHGFLTVYLLTQGKIRCAVAADINEGPLSRCRALVHAYSLQNKVKCVLCDGLEKISPNDAQDIAVCGMGGDMIAHILQSSEWIKNRDKHFIFNPMTHPEKLREFLCKNGFEIAKDRIVRDGDHFYSVFDAYYTGRVSTPPEWFYYIGKIDDFSGRAYFERLIKYLKNKEKSGYDYTDVIKYIEAKL